MSSPKRHVFISLLFILKCFSKPLIIRNNNNNNNNNDLAVDNPWGGSPCSHFQVELEFGKLVLEGRGKLEDPKNTQTDDAGSLNWTWVRVMEGECSHRCTIPANCTIMCLRGMARAFRLTYHKLLIFMLHQLL